MSRRQHMFISFGQPAIRRCNWCLEIEGEHGEGCHTRESLLEDVQALSSENKKLNDFSQGLVAINLSLTDQVSQLRDEINQIAEAVTALTGYKPDGDLSLVEDIIDSVDRFQQYIDRSKREIIELKDEVFSQAGQALNAIAKAEKLEAENKDLRETFVKAVQTSYDPIYVDEVVRQRDNLKKENHLLSEHATKQTAKSTRLEAENVRLKENAQIAGQYFSAWKSIINVMDLLAPDWRQQKPLNQSDKVSSAIKDLAEDAKKFRSLQHVATVSDFFTTWHIQSLPLGLLYALPDQSK